MKALRNRLTVLASCIAGVSIACTTANSPSPSNEETPDSGHADSSVSPFDAGHGGDDAPTPIDGNTDDATTGDDGGTTNDASSDVATDADAGPCGAGAPSDFVAYWAAEGDAKDSTSNHYDGTLSASGATFGTGRFGMAFEFDGSGYVGLPDGIIPANTTGFTLAAWFNPASLPTSDAAGSNALIFYGGANAGEYQLNVASDGTVSCGLKLSDTNWYFASTAPGTGTAGAWHLAICVIDGQSLDGGASVDAGSTVQLSVDGQISGIPVPALSLYQTGGFPSSIGTYAQNHYGTSAAFHGAVDEARLYTRALTPAEVQGFPLGCGF